MSLANALRGAAKAALAVEGLGAAVTLTRTTNVYDPATGTNTPTTTTYAGRGAAEKYSDGLVDGTLIKAGDRKVLVQLTDTSITPATTDRLTIGGVQYTIVKVDPINAGATAVAYQIQARTA